MYMQLQLMTTSPVSMEPASNYTQVFDFHPPYLSLDFIFHYVIVASEYLQKTKSQSNKRAPSLYLMPGWNGLYSVPAEIASVG